jgi:DNA-directed RNA polymerase subunit alpha
MPLSFRTADGSYIPTQRGLSAGLLAAADGATRFRKKRFHCARKLVYFRANRGGALVRQGRFIHEDSGQDARLRPAAPPITRGREPAMTRVPLNRAFEDLQDVRQRLEMSTAEIGLAVRTTNCLEERGVFTVDDLLHCTREDLLSISNFGEKTLEEVYKALESVGFYRPGRCQVGVGSA